MRFEIHENYREEAQSRKGQEYNMQERVNEKPYLDLEMHFLEIVD